VCIGPFAASQACATGWQTSFNPALLRLSIGLESSDDLIADLQTALSSVSD
jgi:cystathionine beta-lyase/cystathionine gamma-synthase